MIKAVNVSLPIFVACLLVFIYSLFFTRRWKKKIVMLMQ